MRQINIIPHGYQGNPREALGYGWQDYANQIPGDDRIGGYDKFLEVKAELEADGFVCLSPEEKRPALASIEARVDCMWSGGASLLAYRMQAGAPGGENSLVINRGEEPNETAAAVRMDEKLHEMELDERYRKHPGWCKECHSFCYGDCEASR